MYYRDQLKVAASHARRKDDGRHFKLGALGIRKDGVKVYAYNGYALGGRDPKAHCEVKLIRKLDQGATIFLARTTADGQWANASPCTSCRRALISAKVKRVVYTIGPNEFGIWDI